MIRKPGGQIGTMHPGVPCSSIKPTARDLEWAAGFLEGEGCFRRSWPGKGGTEHVSASQKIREPLEKLQTFFGGSIGPDRIGGTYRWQVYGPRARGVSMTLYSLLSNRRQKQIRDALNGTR